MRSLIHKPKILFLDERIGAGDIRFRLVVVVVGNKVMHCVFREKFLILLEKPLKLS
jgi:ABC-type molybdenum transport system ATPase subunit/photorepair protein PhrA